MNVQLIKVEVLCSLLIRCHSGLSSGCSLGNYAPTSQRRAVEEITYRSPRPWHERVPEAQSAEGVLSKVQCGLEEDKEIRSNNNNSCGVLSLKEMMIWESWLPGIGFTIFKVSVAVDTVHIPQVVRKGGIVKQRRKERESTISKVITFIFMLVFMYSDKQAPELNLTYGIPSGATEQSLSGDCKFESWWSYSREPITDQNWPCSLVGRDGTHSLTLSTESRSQWCCIGMCELVYVVAVWKHTVGWLHASQRKHVLTFTLPGWKLLYDGRSWQVGENWWEKQTNTLTDLHLASFVNLGLAAMGNVQVVHKTL